MVGGAGVIERPKGGKRFFGGTLGMSHKKKKPHKGLTQNNLWQNTKQNAVPDPNKPCCKGEGGGT